MRRCIAHSLDSGLILFAHGARDVRWAEPFERVRTQVERRMPNARVALAFLEFCEPDLAQAALRMAEQGVLRIRIVPLFFGRGGHLRADFPRQLNAVRAAAAGTVRCHSGGWRG